MPPRPIRPDLPALIKSALAFRTIAEVAHDLELPPHVLRFWETKFPQIKPVKRRGGRRYYRPEDVETIRQVRALLYGEGYTIRGVQKLLRDSGRPLAASSAIAEGAMSVPLTEPIVGYSSDDQGERSAMTLRRELTAVLDELKRLRDRLAAD